MSGIIHVKAVKVAKTILPSFILQMYDFIISENIQVFFSYIYLISEIISLNIIPPPPPTLYFSFLPTTALKLCPTVSEVTSGKRSIFCTLNN